MDFSCDRQAPSGAVVFACRVMLKDADIRDLGDHALERPEGAFLLMRQHTTLKPEQNIDRAFITLDGDVDPILSVRNARGQSRQNPFVFIHHQLPN